MGWGGMRMGWGFLTGLGTPGREGDGMVQTWPGCPPIAQDSPAANSPQGSVRMLRGAVAPQCPPGCNTLHGELREGT